MEHPPVNVTVLDGKDAIMTCNAVGAPTPNVTWYYHGKLSQFLLKTSNYDFL